MKILLTNLRAFFAWEPASGILLLSATMLAIIAANTGFAETYRTCAHALTPLVNDGLMSIFFLVVGLEIREEILCGELRSAKKSILPIAAALGGMIVPALCYWIVNIHTQFKSGWGIPTATDIAFALSALSILKDRIPGSLKIFLMVLAIVDDIGAVLVIALFYTTNLEGIFLVLAAVVTSLMLVLSNIAKRFPDLQHPFLYIILGCLLWFAVHHSGIHPTVSGILLAFALPVSQYQTWQKSLHPITSNVVVPMFAFVNAGVLVSFSTLAASIVHPASLGIIIGLVIGKPLGIMLTVFTLFKFFKVELPTGARLTQVLGVGLFAGIGFTVSIFIAQLAFTDPSVLMLAKTSIVLASALAAVLGMITIIFSVKYSE